MKKVACLKRSKLHTKCEVCRFQINKVGWPRCEIYRRHLRKRKYSIGFVYLCGTKNLFYRRTLVLEAELEEPKCKKCTHDTLGYIEAELETEGGGMVSGEIEITEDDLNIEEQLYSEKCPECGVETWSNDIICYCTCCGYKLDEECE